MKQNVDSESYLFLNAFTSQSDFFILQTLIRPPFRIKLVLIQYSVNWSSVQFSHFHWGVLTTYTYHLRRRFTLSTQYPFNVSFAIASFEHALHVFLFFCHCIPTLIRSSSFFLQRIFEASFSNDIDIKGDRTDRGQRKS